MSRKFKFQAKMGWVAIVTKEISGDEGPWSDTQMYLIKAQEDYRRLIKGANLISMLSSVLDSLGVGMISAGVRLVRVNIKSTTVTKLSDRGSVQSVGIVTEVGLFLDLLIQRSRPLETKVAA